MALWEWRPGGARTAGCSWSRRRAKPFSLNEPQFVTLDHDSALVDNDEAGVVGPGVVRNCDLLVREHAGHVARLVDVEIHAQNDRPLRHSWPRACRTLRLHRPDNQVNYGSLVDGVARRLNDSGPRVKTCGGVS